MALGVGACSVACVQFENALHFRDGLRVLMRIVTGRDGERYYTDDHYDTFRLIVGEPGA